MDGLELTVCLPASLPSQAKLYEFAEKVQSS